MVSHTPASQLSPGRPPGADEANPRGTDESPHQWTELSVPRTSVHNCFELPAAHTSFCALSAHRDMLKQSSAQGDLCPLCAI